MPRWLAGRFSANGVRFGCYHQVVNSLSDVDPESRRYALTTEEFKSHLHFFKREGIEVVGMKKAMGLINSGGARHGRYVCLTFDDGYADSFSVAWPLLREAGYNAHFFLVSRFLDQEIAETSSESSFPKRYMRSEDVRLIVEQGGSVGCHGASHTNFTDLTPEALREEITECREKLSGLTQAPIDTLAFPYGAYNNDVLDIVLRGRICLELSSGIRRRQISASEQLVAPPGNSRSRYRPPTCRAYGATGLA